jgi:hypothetical protein
LFGGQGKFCHAEVKVKELDLFVTDPRKTSLTGKAQYR